MTPSAVSGFLNYKKVEIGLSPNTMECYERDLMHFCSWLAEHRTKNPADANVADVREYLAWYNQLGVCAATVGRRISALREFYKHLQRDGILTRNPMLHIELPKIEKRIPKAIAETEIVQLINAPEREQRANPFSQGAHFHALTQGAVALRDRAIIETLYAGGMRADELVSARLSDVNLQDRVFTVTGKGSKTRIVPLGLPAARAIYAYLAHGRADLTCRRSSPYLFLNGRGGKLTRQRLWQLTRERAQRAGITRISPHVLRHSAATHMLDHDANLRVIQEILGHSDISTTQLYTKVSQTRLREVFFKCHPRQRMGGIQLSLGIQAAPALYQAFVKCWQCANPAVEGHSLCEVHMKTQQAAARRHRELNGKGKYVEKRTQGMCPHCNSPAAPGKAYCERHLSTYRRYNAKAYRVRKCKEGVSVCGQLSSQLSLRG